MMLDEIEKGVSRETEDEDFACCLRLYGRERYFHELAVEAHLRAQDAAVMAHDAGHSRFNPQAVYGLPLTPARLLQDLTGASFSISYWNEAPENPRGSLGRAQAAEAMALIGPHSTLMLDNGAFSVWTENRRRAAKGLPPIAVDDAYWLRYWIWAVGILATTPQAVAVIPDVIGGSVEENLRLIQQRPDFLHPFESQLMPVWHLDEPLDHLEWLVEDWNRIAFGSAGLYRTPGSSLWRHRVQQAFDLLYRITADGSGICFPRVHMMRGLGQMSAGEFPFTTADSTNIARNHHRLADAHGDHRVAVMRSRTEEAAFPPARTTVFPRSPMEFPISRQNQDHPAPLQMDLIVHISA